MQLDDGEAADRGSERVPHPFRQQIRGVAAREGGLDRHRIGSSLFRGQGREGVAEGRPGGRRKGDRLPPLDLVREHAFTMVGPIGRTFDVRVKLE